LIIQESKVFEGFKPLKNMKAILKGTPISFEASDNVHKDEQIALMQFQAKVLVQMAKIQYIANEFGKQQSTQDVGFG